MCLPGSALHPIWLPCLLQGGLGDLSVLAWPFFPPAQYKSQTCVDNTPTLTQREVHQETATADPGI